MAAAMEKVLTAFLIVLLLLSSCKPAIGCYNSIFSFGDSLTDTGNLLHISQNSGNLQQYFSFSPYGETYFHRPTGRLSDGRIILDFIAEHLGLELIPPYFGNGNVINGDFNQGVNFAVAGATAMEYAFYEKIGIHNSVTNVSLGDQLTWFKQILPSFCDNPSSMFLITRKPSLISLLNPVDCKDFLKTRLFIIGEIGGNDYTHAFFGNRTLKEIQSFVDPVIHVIGTTINELIEIGAVTLVVPGNFPIGCVAIYLNYFSSSPKEDYDPETGCILWLNEFSRNHNKKLLEELNKIRKLYPHVNIIYADYYNAAMSIYQSPTKYGFKDGELGACCGDGGGLYNVNRTGHCGYPSSKACDDPSTYINWDGIHFTEAAYKWIFKRLFEEYTFPPIQSSCVSSS